MKLRWLALFPTALVLACASPQNTKMKQANAPFDIQGHRGCRGLLPENSIPAFLKAVDLGVTTLELDVVISKDRQIVVSHEPWLAARICTGSTGQAIAPGEEKKYNLYQMEYAEIERCDCGSKGDPSYPEQQKLKVAKPLLSATIDAVEKYVADKQLPKPNYNIEIKSVPDEYTIFQPEPTAFCEMVYQLLKEKKMLKRINIQSFDPKVLQVMHAKYPAVTLAYLVGTKVATEDAIAGLGFVPQIYSPYYKLVTAEMVAFAATKQMKVIPWTVNNYEEMVAIKKLGVDGLITDYPDRAMKLVGQ